MKQVMILLAASTLLFGCKKELDVDTSAPPPPQGIRTISLDNMIEIQWLLSQADDVKGYNVWVSRTYDGRYELIASTTETTLIDYGAKNGTTYYYAVSAYDFNDNESALSKDVVYDTPRPEGFGVVLVDTSTSPRLSGFGFAQHVILNCYDIGTDFFFVNKNGRLVLQVWSDTDIQDMGFSSSLDEISSSPKEGWAPSKSAEAIAGHTYVIWTVDDHFAKVRVREAGAARLVFDWAYQTAKGNPELKRSYVLTAGNQRLGRILH